MIHLIRRTRLFLLWLTLLALAQPAVAQVTAAAASTPPNDTQSIHVGATIFYDYTYQSSPKATDAGGSEYHPSAFQVSRSYININGTLSHVVSFRITPDITRETAAGSSVSGSLVFRLKYAFAQLNFDAYTGDWHSTWVRLGQQQTPFVDYHEGIYRYRFQGTTFAERVGSMSSSDSGVSFHTNLPSNYGDFHVGIYNGENYGKPEANAMKAFEVRGTVRPLGRGSLNARGWRVTGFYTNDAPVSGGRRDRGLFETTYEHKYFTFGYDYLSQFDKVLPTAPEIHQSGWSVFLTPFLKEKGHGPEALFRYDDYTNHGGSAPGVVVAGGEQKRTIVGFAYWFPHPGGNATAALLVDYDSVTQTGAPRNTKIAVHGLINF